MQKRGTVSNFFILTSFQKHLIKKCLFALTSLLFIFQISNARQVIQILKFIMQCGSTLPLAPWLRVRLCAHLFFSYLDLLSLELSGVFSMLLRPVWVQMHLCPLFLEVFFPYSHLPLIALLSQLLQWSVPLKNMI